MRILISQTKCHLSLSLCPVLTLLTSHKGAIHCSFCPPDTETELSRRAHSQTETYVISREFSLSVCLTLSKQRHAQHFFFFFARALRVPSFGDKLTANLWIRLTTRICPEKKGREERRKQRRYETNAGHMISCGIIRRFGTSCRISGAVGLS